MINWQERTIYEQMGNIGSEIGRAFKWKTIDTPKAAAAAERALRLIDGSLSSR